MVIKLSQKNGQLPYCHTWQSTAFKLLKWHFHHLVDSWRFCSCFFYSALYLWMSVPFSPNLKFAVKMRLMDQDRWCYLSKCSANFARSSYLLHGCFQSQGQNLMTHKINPWPICFSLVKFVGRNVKTSFVSDIWTDI